ncbi:AzlC family ABC transporter permease [Chelatococcus sp. SYSU_G07232]|uniref:AzlC family ABC transporter permease n=1 Tax=Chelatococcus albus TaxID=3047466 RepID=A0ABT7ACW8_9HYPH|nr:AzlC family ABC transporter permease [Chelatococcus sp. SYSU_G07232]MDJ1157213.1 AzlC family ABC transporter permease [Chelatococcus sp. SYSU_G07232]
MISSDETTAEVTEASASHSPLAEFGRGVRHALGYPAWVVGFSLVGVGSLAHDVGHPLAAAVLSTILVWAGPGQVIFYGGLAAGATLPALALAVSLSSTRLLPMTVSLLPLLRRSGQGLGQQFFLAHYVAVTVWMESQRRLPRLPAHARLPYFLGFANACLAVSAVMTGVGYVLAGALPLPLVAGLLFLSPLYFSVSIIAGARLPADWLAFGFGLLVAPVAARWIAGGFDLMATGLVGGTAAYLAGHLRSRRGSA